MRLNPLSGLLDSAPLCPRADAASGWLTVQQLRRDAEHAVRSLPARAEEPETIVAHCADRYALLVACLAAWARQSIVILAPNLQPAALLRVIADSSASVVLTDLDLNDPYGGARVIRLELEVASGALLPSTLLQTEQTLCWLYTSGTTGEHQRVTKCTRQLFGEVEALLNTFELSTDAVFAATVPANHLYGILFSLLLPLFAGARFLRPALLQPHDISSTLSAFSVTHLVTVPVHIQALLRSGVPLEPLRQMFSSGAVLEPALARTFSQTHGAQLFDVLGSTESGGIGFRQPAVATHYIPFVGVRVRSNRVGRLLLSSPFLEDATAWRAMADQIRLVPGGFEHLGRVDGVVKVGSKRVTVQELEARVRALPGIEDAAVLVLPQASLRGVELWLAVASAESSWQAESLREALALEFEAVVLPRRYRIVPQLPRNSLGKLSQEALLALFEESS
jgi:acyl-coenzyme A synthetase/AMP-(fatty) acid ligase